MPITRDAVDTIKGYYYQFNYSIFRILEGQDDDIVTIEGIEDVDVASGDETVAIQCKYYSKTEYHNSIIAKPIGLCLKTLWNVLRKETIFLINYVEHTRQDSLD